MNNPAAPLPLSHADRDVLTKWARSESVLYRIVTRAKVRLIAGDGVANSHIATTLGHQPTDSVELTVIGCRGGRLLRCGALQVG